MKQRLAILIQSALKRAGDIEGWPTAGIPEIQIDKPKLESHGDFSTNIAMVLASGLKLPPRKIAEKIISYMDDSPGEATGILEKTEIAGPGFINFFISPTAWHPVLRQIEDQDRLYGASDIGRGEKIQVEFVSPNPTGPLHVGHGRGAAVGDSVANILAFCGYDVQREYYINDSGRQIATLGRSVFLRYQEFFGETVRFPEDLYQGDYIRDIAAEIKQKESDRLLEMDETEAVMFCAKVAADIILSGIREDLHGFGVEFHRWFSEQSLFDTDRVDGQIKAFQRQGVVYEKDGALWFNTRQFGDEKDRVVVRSNGQTTYFASDIAYHMEKFERGFDRVIDVWGADHHGYVPRMTAAIQASGRDSDRFQVILVQLVNLLRGGEPVAMSTRAGEFVTLKDVVDEVGRDAARFIFLTRNYDSPLDFDLEVAKKKTNDNPVYYVQYVHARICSIIRKARERDVPTGNWDESTTEVLVEPEEIRLIKTLAAYPETVLSSCRQLEPHRIAYYLMNLASVFHAYYNKHRVLSDDKEITAARIVLVRGVKRVIRNGLSLLGVSAPQKM